MSAKHESVVQQNPRLFVSVKLYGANASTIAMQAPVRGRAHPQKSEEQGGREEGAQAGGGYELRHAGGYIPRLATISIGQDRKYTIEGSSATDKDYPTNTNKKWQTS